MEECSPLGGEERTYESHSRWSQLPHWKAHLEEGINKVNTHFYLIRAFSILKIKTRERNPFKYTTVNPGLLSSLPLSLTKKNQMLSESEWLTEQLPCSGTTHQAMCQNSLGFSDNFSLHISFWNKTKWEKKTHSGSFLKLSLPTSLLRPYEFFAIQLFGEQFPGH